MKKTDQWLLEGLGKEKKRCDKRISFWVDENVLELDTGDGCATF